MFSNKAENIDCCGTTYVIPKFGQGINGVLMEYDKFLHLFQKCLEPQPSESDFRSKLNSLCPTEWSKMNKLGEYYEEINTFASYENCEALIKIPYPPKLLLESIFMKNDGFTPSVQDCHFICWWVDKTIKRIGFLDTLQKRIIYQLNCNRMQLPPIFIDNEKNEEIV